MVYHKTFAVPLITEQQQESVRHKINMAIRCHAKSHVSLFVNIVQVVWLNFTAVRDLLRTLIFDDTLFTQHMNNLCDDNAEEYIV